MRVNKNVFPPQYLLDFGANYIEQTIVHKTSTV